MLQAHKPIYYWVYQTAFNQANIHIKDQPIQLTDGFIRIHSQAITVHTARFIRLLSQTNITVGFIRLSNQGSHMAKCTTRHNQANTPFGFIRLLSQDNIQLGLPSFPTKPIYHWVYQVVSQANLCLGLSRC